MQEKPDVEMASEAAMEAELARSGQSRPSPPPSPSRPARVEHALLCAASDALEARSMHAPRMRPSDRPRGKGRGSGRRDLRG